MNKREGSSAMFAIDCEIGIERQHGVLLIDLGYPHDARIGERHRSIPIFLMQLEQGGDMLLDAERDLERTEKFEQCVLRPGEAREQMHRLGQDRLIHERRRSQLLKLLGDPAVMLFRSVEEATNGPVSTMAARIATKACEILGIGREVGTSRIHRSARCLHQPSKALMPMRWARGFEHES
jgi:hypothetical protein